MRSKVAKRLRKAAYDMSKDMPEIGYDNTVVKRVMNQKLVSQIMKRPTTTLENMKEALEEAVEDRVQRTLVADCKRRMYKELKKVYKEL